MTTECRNKVREHLKDLGEVELTIVDENDQFIENQKFTSYDEAVCEIEFQENTGNTVFI